MRGVRSAIHGFTFVLDQSEKLVPVYDADIDTLSLWRGSPRPVRSIETTPGCFVLIDDATKELAGFEIVDWDAVWSDQREIPFRLPIVAQADDGDSTAEDHLLHVCS